MAKSNFKIFAEGATNIQSDSEYETDTQRQNGVSPGLAIPSVHNKLYKQATIMAAALAQVLVEQGNDALDSNYTSLVKNLRKTFLLTLNGEKPDANGNIEKKFVFSVNDNKPDENGNVTLDINVLDKIYPVGSVYVSVTETNPHATLGGKWTLLNAGKYIKAAGDSFAGGSMGGSNSVSLGVNNIPNHTHGAIIYGDGSHKHEMTSRYRCEYGNGGFSDGFQPAVTYGNNSSLYNCMSLAGTHSHGISISATGAGEAFTVQPEYLALYFWRRDS